MTVRALPMVELARRCREFLRQFFHAWDDAPQQADFAGHAAWLKRLAEDLGIPRAAAESPADTAALARLKTLGSI